MEQAIDASKLVQFQEGMAKLKNRFWAMLPERVKEFDQLLDDLYADEDTAKVVETIGQLAHKLQGQAGTFGLGDVGELAAQLEREVMATMERPRPLDTEGVEVHLVSLLDKIEARLSAA